MHIKRFRLMLCVCLSLCFLNASTLARQASVYELRDVWKSKDATIPSPTHFLATYPNTRTSFGVSLFRHSLEYPQLPRYLFELPDLPSMRQNCHFNYQQLWITCELVDTDNVALSMTSINGLTSRVIAPPRSGNYIQHDWNPSNGEIVAFTDIWENDANREAISIYDVSSNQMLWKVGPCQWRRLIGWRSSDELLIFATTDDQSVDVIELNVRTRQVRTIIDNSPTTLLYPPSFYLAPNNQYLLMRQPYENIPSCLYNFQTAYCEPVTWPQDTTPYWSPDSSGLLALSSWANTPSFFIDVQKLDQPIAIHIPSRPESAATYDLLYPLSFSPDGTFALFREASSEEERSVRLLLYDIAANDWHIIAVVVDTPQFIGWEHQPEIIEPVYRVFIANASR